jgi:hypothetical protein
VAYGLQCLEPTLFNYSAGFLQNVKEQITRCRVGQKKQFGYGSFLVSFFLERIPGMQPQIALPVRPAREPRMERWTNLSPRLGPDSEFKFTNDFFTWLRRQLIVIEDFPYAVVYFRGSMDLVLPEDERRQLIVIEDFPYAGVDFWGIVDLVLPEGEDCDASGKKSN